MNIKITYKELCAIITMVKAFPDFDSLIDKLEKVREQAETDQYNSLIIVEGNRK